MAKNESFTARSKRHDRYMLYLDVGIVVLYGIFIVVGPLDGRVKWYNAVVWGLLMGLSLGRLWARRELKFWKSMAWDHAEVAQECCEVVKAIEDHLRAQGEDWKQPGSGN